jgi:hypothetical protein
MSFLLSHHQNERADVVVGLVIVVPVVAVETSLVPVQVEAVAVRVAGYVGHHPNHCPSKLSRLYRILRP